MTVNSEFKIKHLSTFDLRDVEIMDVSASRSYGRRFKLLINGVESKQYVFKDLYRKIEKLVKKNPEDELLNLMEFKPFLVRLKEFDTQAELVYSKREWLYRFRTWFHRFFDLCSHSDNIDRLIYKAEKRISKIFYQDTLVNDPAFLDIEKILEVKSSIELNNLLYALQMDVNLQNAYGFSALIFASANGLTVAAKLLLEHGDIDVNLQNHAGTSAIITATFQGNKEMVEILLQHDNIDIHLKNNNGDSALSLAIDKGHTEIEALLKARI